MPKWTSDQQEAIDKEGSNIIVSAGAGSGKTAVLTARVIRKLKQGINVNELLILTFTNAAAAEMKERIRNAIKKDPTLFEQLALIDGAYITTFDSFSLSLVKKYHYLLGIDRNINIAEDSVIYCKKSSIIDNVFEELYQEENSDFKKLIYDFCIKDDREIKNHIVNISNKMDLLYDKESYLVKYMDNFYQDEMINKNISSFLDSLFLKKEKIVSLFNDLAYHVDSDYMDKTYTLINDFLEATNYLQLKSSLDFRLPNLPKNSSDEAKLIKENIASIIKELKTICVYLDDEDIRNGIMSTKVYVKAIIDIITRVDKELNLFKKNNNIYEFNDISKMAIKVLIDNPNVCFELKQSLNEIMVDEYQDTSDLQELFISLVEDNNVYMVGDIKQSIYRFRNANPYIFKNKYDGYALGNGGYKIDLNKNFRSRGETLNDINVIFNIIMDDLLGGADYKSSHQMIFGNSLYLENDLEEQNNNLEIYNYSFDKDQGYNKDEIECFIVAKDIINKVKNKYQVFDKETSCLRDIKYSDFVILMDRATKFDLYKKIFEYLNIPLTKYTDTSITDSNDILILKNIIGLVIKWYKKEVDTEFKYCFTSVARSYLFRLDDEEIFKLLETSAWNNKIIEMVKEVVLDYENLSIKELINQLIDKFSFYENLIKVGNVQASIIRLEYLYNLASSCENIGFDIEGFYNYLNKLVEDDYSIKVSISENTGDSVKIMTIHKSKGLEYPICYYTGIYASFNTADVKERFIFDNKYGIITPYFKEGIAKTIYSYLFKDIYLKEEISEKIRLFYVALTRCREKMIIVGSLEDKTMNDSEQRFGYKSFLDMLNSIYDDLRPYITEVSLEEAGLTKEYDLIKGSNYKSDIKLVKDKIEIVDTNIANRIVDKSSYSKSNRELLTQNIRTNIELGSYLHHILEMIDFKDPNFDIIDVNYRPYIENFLNIGLDFYGATIYKEYEFVYNDGYNNKHGIIDLMLKYKDQVKIIDYKLNNIVDDAYSEQLNGYKKYVSEITRKTVKIYLYSILTGELKEL